MAFWNDPTLEPKRNFRWLLLFNEIPQFVVKKVTKPSFKITSAEHKYLIHTFYYPGRVEWQEVSVSISDPVNPDSSQALVNILTASGYRLPVNENVTQTIAKAPSTAAVGNFTLQQLNAEGAVIEQWLMVNAWVSEVTFGELDYSNDELVNIDIKFKYDFAQKVI